MGWFSRKRNASDVDEIELKDLILKILENQKPSVPFLNYHDSMDIGKYLEKYFERHNIKIARLNNHTKEVLQKIIKSPRAEDDGSEIQRFLDVITGKYWLEQKRKDGKTALKAGAAVGAAVAVNKVENAKAAMEKVVRPRSIIPEVSYSEVLDDGYYFQYSANSKRDLAERNASMVLGNTGLKKVFIKQKRDMTLYRVLIGPFQPDNEYSDTYVKLLDFITKFYGKKHFSDEFIIFLSSRGEEDIFEIRRVSDKEPESLVDAQGKGIAADEKGNQEYMDFMSKKKVQVKKRMEEHPEENMIEVLSSPEERELAFLKKNVPSDLFDQIVSAVYKNVVDYNKKPYFGEVIDPFLILATIKKESNFKPDARGYDIEKINGKWVKKVYRRNGKEYYALKAKGLMQVAKISLKNKEMCKEFFNDDKNHAEAIFNSEKIFDIEYNIRLGIFHFAYTLDRMTYTKDKRGVKVSRLAYRTDIERLKFTLAAYNGGVDAIKSSMSYYRKKHGLGEGYEFDKVKKYINAESREYVPKLLGFVDKLRRKVQS